MSGRVLYVTAHPDDEHNGLLVRAGPRPGSAHRSSHPDPGRGRTKRHRLRAVRRARCAPHRGVDGDAQDGRRRAVFRPPLRVRLLLQCRGDLREVGSGADHRGHRAGHPCLPPRRRADPPAGGARSRGAAPSSGRPAHPGRLSRRRRPCSISRPAERWSRAVAGAEALPGRNRRLPRRSSRDARRDGDRCL